MPRRKKPFSVRKRSHSAPASLRRPTGSRSAKRKQWSEEMYAFSQWLHEECVEDCVLDSTGKERLCPLCLLKYYDQHFFKRFSKNIITAWCCTALCTWGYSIYSAVAAIESI